MYSGVFAAVKDDWVRSDFHRQFEDRNAPIRQNCLFCSRIVLKRTGFGGRAVGECIKSPEPAALVGSDKSRVHPARAIGHGQQDANSKW